MITNYKLIKRARSPFYLLRLAQPAPDGWSERSTKQTSHREAQRVAAEIVAGLDSPTPPRRTWAAFRADYELKQLPQLASPGPFRAAARHLERLLKPKYLDELTAARLRLFRHQLEAAGYAPCTVASYLKHLRAALGWGAEFGYLTHAPRVRVGSTARRRGRALDFREFQRMLAVTADVVGPARARSFRRLLRGLWHTGLRLQEAIDLDWTDPQTIHPQNLETHRPLLAFPAHRQKNRREQLVPLTPAAAAFLLKTPPAKRCGPVFPIQGAHLPITTADRASRIISRIGLAAGIITRRDERTGQIFHATAHDLRRSFATRYAKLLPPDLLRELMRHASIETTRAHYIEPDANHLADRVWNALEGIL